MDEESQGIGQGIQAEQAGRYWEGTGTVSEAQWVPLIQLLVTIQVRLLLQQTLSK